MFKNKFAFQNVLCYTWDNLIQTIVFGSTFFFFIEELLGAEDIQGSSCFFEDKTGVSVKSGYADGHSPRVRIVAVETLLEKTVKRFCTKRSENVPKYRLCSKPNNLLPAQVVSRHLKLFTSKSTIALV